VLIGQELDDQALYQLLNGTEYPIQRRLLNEMNMAAENTDGKLQRSLRRLTKFYMESTEKHADRWLIALIIALFVLIVVLIAT
jgi:type II secretory pathway component PulF